MEKTNRKKLTAYLIWAFAIAWAMQIPAGILYRTGHTALYSLMLSASMFAPLAAALLSGCGLRGMGWKPRIKGNVGSILLAWFLPAILGAAGAALYFAIFPSAFDTGLSFILSQVGEEGIAQLEASGLTLPLYAAITCATSITWAPLINMLFAVGEEAGWRGTMYPILRERFGGVKGRLIGGTIWGVWHWPIMLLAGYEYGLEYWGAPITGPLLFCVITIAMGVLLDRLYEKSRSIWVPALCHGAINAFAGIPTLFLSPEYADRLLIGPLMIGVIGGAPLILTATIILIKTAREQRADK